MSSSDSPILNYIRAAIGRDGDDTTDAELLDRFVSNRDNAAFELLVWRHTGTVLRTCRAVLHDHHAAEDAVQATFLALARQANSIRNRESIVGWLYCISRRIATRLAQRRSTSALTVRDLSNVVDVRGTVEADEASPIHQELAYLPEKYRLPILLCCFEDLSLADAARKLGWPMPTVGTRLARAKILLHRRLARRGVVIPVAGVAAMITANPVGAIKMSFITVTARAAVKFASGSSVGGVSEAVVRMAKVELRGLFVGKAIAALGYAACLSMAIATAAY